MGLELKKLTSIEELSSPALDWKRKAAFCLQIARPKHWLKNLLILLPWFFASQSYSSDFWVMVALTVICMSLYASAGYAINDLIDRERDLRHPDKQNRPLASSHLSTPLVLFFSFSLFSTASVLSLLLPSSIGFVVSTYFVGTIFYSFTLKQIPYAEILFLAILNTYRVFVGTLLFAGVAPQIYIFSFFLMLFLALSKRAQELQLLGINAQLHRPVLAYYSQGFLKRISALCLFFATAGYLSFIVSQPSFILVASFIPLMAGNMRYLSLSFRKKDRGDPIANLVHDYILGSAVLSWVAMLIIHRFQ